MTASLFGLSRSNRDFSQSDAWGKNQFNSSFPAALCCYMAHLGLPAKYLSIQKQQYTIAHIAMNEVLGGDYTNEDMYFGFESVYTPYQPYVVGSLPRTDLVTQDTRQNKCLRGLEIKLTALPDNVTCDAEAQYFGSEIVVRPDSIVYLACSIIASRINLADLLDRQSIQIADWTDAAQVIPFIPAISAVVRNIALRLEVTQQPFLIQPIWKREGQSPQLSNQCLDCFVWSNAGFTYFISQVVRTESIQTITRMMRTIIWLYKMLSDYVDNTRFNHKVIIDTLSYNTKNDKAFACNGSMTNPYMRCEALNSPRIHKNEIQNIILGGGQNLLSPERRFDAIIYNSPNLFESVKQ